MSSDATKPESATPEAASPAAAAPAAQPAPASASAQKAPAKRSSAAGVLLKFVLAVGAVALGAAYSLGLIEFGGAERGPSRTASVGEPEAKLNQTESVAATTRSRIDPVESGDGGGRGAPEIGAPPSADAAAAEDDRFGGGRDVASGGAPPRAPEVASLDRGGADERPIGEASGTASSARRSTEAALAELAPADPNAPRGAGDPGAEIRPEFDVVRVPPDGSVVLAGRAAPGAVVEILVDGEPTTTVTAESTGEFVALLDAPSNPSRAGGSRRIDLSAKNPDGTVLDSAAPVIITMPAAPDEVPVAVAPTKEGVDILQAPSREDKSDVSIDSVSYGDGGDVVVSGRGDPGQTARLYLDNSLQAEARVSDDGSWRAEITKEVKPARYNLRVDQTTSEGAVTSRAETPFERAEPADIKIAQGTVIVQPGNNLWRIASYVYGDGTRYTVIYGKNKTQIRNPNLIYPGQVLDLPDPDQILAR